MSDSSLLAMFIGQEETFHISYLPMWLHEEG